MNAPLIARRRLFTLLAAAPLAVGVSPAAADDGYRLAEIPASTPMPTYGRAPLVKGWVRFAVGWPDQVAAAPAVLEATQGAWHTIHRCLADMPIRRWAADPANRWELKRPGGAGNCADIALTMRNSIVRAGIPIGAVRPTICATPAGQHMVLCVVTDRGDFILDMFDTAIVPWPLVPYLGIVRYWSALTWDRLQPRSAS